MHILSFIQSVRQMPMSRKDRLYHALSTEFVPEQLLVEDESYMHSVMPGSESHFKITAVSTRFIAMSRINRHRLVQTLLSHEFNTGLHALSLHLFTPDEWAHQSVPSSPKCLGGKRKDKDIQ